MSPKRAVILSGSLGLGHHIISEVLNKSLDDLGWETRTLDCMRLLTPVGAALGNWVFRRLTTMPTLFDGIHFTHLRQGTALAMAADRQATNRLVPALGAELDRQPADLLVGVFATGASAAAKLSAEAPGVKTIVLCTDVDLHRLWVWEGIDLYLVTSEAAAATVRRYQPRARIAVVPPPVRTPFYEVPAQPDARVALGVPADDPCVLVMGGGWGLGPLAETAAALARGGVHVLAVAGHNPRLHRRLRALAEQDRYVHPFGYTERIPELMAAADLVLTAPGATTCSEARVVGRRMVLLDVVPGHGRENLQHELEDGSADVGSPDPDELTTQVLAALDRIERPLPRSRRPADEWPRAFAQALAELGLAPPGPAGGQAPGSADQAVPAPRGGADGVGDTAGERDARAFGEGPEIRPREEAART